ncbi:hypothetical protein CR513_05178, partial [Mucuna pruriens]
MAANIYDDKVLIHCFQDSLTRAALSLYVILERGRIKTWRDLAEAFLKQHKYNEDMGPDQSRLQNMIKKEHEDFKEYAQRWHELAAQRWHELAAQVQPPITEREMVTMFIDTFPSLYYNKIVGNVASNFANLVVFAQTNNNTSFAKKPTSERKKGEANTVLIEPIFPQTKANTSSYSTRIQGGSRSTTTQPTPYIPPSQPRADTRTATNTRLTQ